MVWEPDAWNAANAKHQSSDISRVVQEIVDRGGWVSGNAMAFIIEGEGRRVAESYDGALAGSEAEEAAPRLVIEYVTAPVPEIASFQQGVDEYQGTVDTYLHSGAPDADNSTATPLVVDANAARHILMRFEDIFGAAAGQIPEGAVIQSASLEFEVTDESDAGASLHRMLQTWNDTDTWNSRVGGIQADGSEAAATAESSSHGSPVGASSIDVTTDLQAWSDNPASNHGWAWLPPTADNSWQLDSAEGGTPPVLTVKYFVPRPIRRSGVGYAAELRSVVSLACPPMCSRTQ